MGCKQCKKSKLGIFKLKYIKNFLTFLFTNIKFGWKRVSFNAYMERKLVCAACPFFDRESGRCLDCGCWINNKAKWVSESCPQGKWR